MPQINLAERIFFCEFCRYFSSRFYIVFAFDYHRDNLCDFVHIFFVHTPGCYCRSSQSHAACDKRRTGIIWYGIFIAGNMCIIQTLFKLFGKNAELLIDHAWGCEPCTVEAVKAYKPGSNSLGSGQVLHEPYTADKARIVLREMADALSMDLFSKNLVTDQLVVTIGYDIENIKDAKRRAQYKGEIVRDGYGRLKPKHSHGTVNLPRYTSSTKQIMDAAAELYDRVVDKTLLIRRLNITACRVIPEADAPKEAAPEQMDMFTDYAELDAERERENAALEREKRKQAALLKIKNKYGKNAVLRGMNFEEGATMRDRNGKIGGHKA